jgi:hypothetical protein
MIRGLIHPSMGVLSMNAPSLISFALCGNRATRLRSTDSCHLLDIDDDDDDDDAVGAWSNRSESLLSRFSSLQVRFLSPEGKYIWPLWNTRTKNQLKG